MSDFLKLTLTVLKVFHAKYKPKIIQYRDFSHFDYASFKADLLQELSLQNVRPRELEKCKYISSKVLDIHAPIKEKHVRCNQSTFMTGEFNVRSSSWWSDDINTVEWMRLESITSYYALHQIINEPTHILPSSTSCIDLIFTNQPNLVINSGVHPSLHQNCHHQIIFAKINLKVYYPPPYKRLVWDYKKANIDAINLAIKSFNWENAFNGKDINSQVKLFNETLLNIFSNFIPNKIKTFRDSDPPWINDDIKSKIKLKHKLYHRYLRHKRNKEDFAKVEHLRNEICNLISKSKKEYNKISTES